MTNSRARNIHPTADFYQLFPPADIEEMTKELSKKCELPLKFTYAGEGADRWDAAVSNLPAEKQKKLLPWFDGVASAFELQADTKPVTVIDLGPGNGLQAQAILEYLLKRHQLSRYIGVDISKRMLDIAADNIDSWSHGAIKAATYVKDFVQNPLGSDILSAKDVCRLLLMLGGTLDNDPSPVAALKIIRQDLRPDDLLLYDVLTPIEAQASSLQPHKLSDRHTFLLQQLGITEDLYESERGYDAGSHTRLDIITPGVDLELSYEVHGRRRSVSLAKGQPITVWRYHSQMLDEAKRSLTKAGFNILDVAAREGGRQALLLCKAS